MDFKSYPMDVQTLRVQFAACMYETFCSIKQTKGDSLTLIFSLEKFERQIKPLGMTYDFKEKFIQIFF